MVVKGSYNKQKGEEPCMVKVTEYAGRKPTSIMDQRRSEKKSCAKAPRCSNGRKFIAVWRSGQGQNIKPDKTRKETAYKNQQKPWGKVVPMDKENKKEEEEAWCWGEGEMDAKASSSKSCWTEQEQRETLTSICRQHKPQLMLEKHFTVPEERISSGTWYNFFPFWIQNRCTFK